jgi:hypothetical protein
MSAANSPTVRIFAPDGNGGYIQWDELTDGGRASIRERVYSQVRRASELTRSARSNEEHRAVVGKYVNELINFLKEDAEQ